MFWRLRMMEETGAAAANVSANNPLVASTNWSSTRFFLSLSLLIVFSTGVLSVEIWKRALGEFL